MVWRSWWGVSRPPESIGVIFRTWPQQRLGTHTPQAGILLGGACQVPDCVSWDGIAQCDSRGRFHRSQVFGEPSRNPAMDTRPAMFPLNGGGLPSGRPRSHRATPLLWMTALEEEMPWGELRVGTILGKKISRLFFTWSAGKQREIGVQHHSVDNKPLSNDIFTGRPQRSPMPTLLWGRWWGKRWMWIWSFSRQINLCDNNQPPNWVYWLITFSPYEI